MDTIGIGFFVQDPTLYETQDKKAKFSRFTLGCKERIRKDGTTKELVNYFQFVIWDKAAELICQYVKKGDQLYFRARPRQDNSDESKHNNVIFRIEDFQIIFKNKKEVKTSET